MHIVQISAEMNPIAKVGGLGDVILGLSRELSWKGHHVEIILPHYDCLNEEELPPVEQLSPTVARTVVEDLPVYLLTVLDHFKRGCFYGCSDDTARFIAFCHAAMAFLKERDSFPDTIHCHDWPTGLIPLLTKDLPCRTILTIHNMDYQGLSEKSELTPLAAAVDPKQPHLYNLLRTGIEEADAVTTVSPTYADEVLTPTQGRDLEGVLQKHSAKFSGILNGIDYSYWNPEIDRYLPQHYTAGEWETKIAFKNKLRSDFYFEKNEKPLVGCITRLIPQKGIDLIEHLIRQAADWGVQVMLLGSSPIPEVHARFSALKQEMQDNLDVYLSLEYNEKLAHRIYAASDLFVVPSLFEPCGLTQMIAMKYGAIPIVRKTGGLADTVRDGTTGFVFEEATPEAMEKAFKRALTHYFEGDWKGLVERAMTADWSWDRSTNRYLELYHASQKVVS